MKKLHIVVAAAALALCSAVAVAAAPVKLKCFSGAPATCSVSGDTATLNTSAGGFAGVSINNARNTGRSLSGATYSFQYNCDPLDDNVSCTGGGSPRWSIPINEPGDGPTEGFAFLDAAGCGFTGTVSTASNTCAVNYDSIDYPNWAAFAAANPTYKIGNQAPFVITDTTEPGTTLIFNVTVPN
jgi:hypothetical protein